MPDGPTQYGFAWGPMEVRRCTDLGRYGRVLRVVTGKEELTIRVTPSGRIRLDEPVRKLKGKSRG